VLINTSQLSKSRAVRASPSITWAVLGTPADRLESL